jgi:hypothetical protein
MATKKKKKSEAATAIHGKSKDGLHHFVGLGNIRVIIVPDGDAFFAQAIEIDYAAQGASVKEVKKHFEIGLESTIEQHLRIYGTIKELLHPAPVAAWLDLLPEKKARHSRYWHVSAHTIKALPYQGIRYLVAKAAA